MKHQTRIDARTLKTKERIWDTFRNMILEMNYNDITVTELTSRVGIHRKTFYLHYESIDTLFSELETKIIDQIGDGIVKSMGDSDTIDFETTKNYFEEFVELDNVLYRRLLLNESYRSIYNHVYDQTAQLMTPYIKNKLEVPDVEAIIVTNFILTGCFEVIRSCQKNNVSISNDKLNKILLSLVNTGISNI